MSDLRMSYQINQVFLNETLPEQVEVVCLKPKEHEFRAVDTSDKEKAKYLNNSARKIRCDRDKPLIADVSESCIVVLPWSPAEGRQMVERGLDRKGLETANLPTKKVSIAQAIYRRLLLRAVEISLRRKGYMVNEVSAVRYQGASTSFAYMYSSGISATNKFFEVYRGVDFRVLLYPKERRAGIIVDPTFHFLPRATIQDFAGDKETLKRWGGVERDGEIVFEPELEVTTVCPIQPEDCKFRISPYESECSLYNPKLDMAVSRSRPGILRNIKKIPITHEPRIRQAIQNCSVMSSRIPDDTSIAQVAFYGSGNIYSYPLQRLRRPYNSNLIHDFVTVLGGSNQDVRTMNQYFDRMLKMPPSERRWYTDLFVKDLEPFEFGSQKLSFEKNLTSVGIKPWKQEPF